MSAACGPDSPARILALSNGHGEDEVAVRVLRQLQQCCPQLSLQALPIVGEGTAYRSLGVEILGPTQTMPSGGFFYMDQKQLWRDLQSGLLAQTVQQLGIVRNWAKQGGLVLAVGDIVPLAIAWWSGAPFVFIGTAKSEYYLRQTLPKPPHSWTDCVYLPWERWLMQRPSCCAVFPRDRLTAQMLQQWPIPVHDLGNPMMDDLEPQGVLTPTDLPDHPHTVLLLPGSRDPEALQNWRLMLQSLSGLSAHRLTFVAAIAGQLDLTDFQNSAQDFGWHFHPATKLSVPHCWLRQESAQLLLVQRGFRDALHLANVAIAMAGTATEQCVGLGLPVLTLPGPGPQFTRAFAQSQTRLLGPSIHFVTDPQTLSQTLLTLLHHPEFSMYYRQNGRLRMGQFGAAKRIAVQIQEILKDKKHLSER